MMWNFLIVLVAVAIYCYTSEFFKLVDPVEYSVNLPDKLDGPLKPNEKLEQAEKLFENVLHWPESFAVQSGNIYTGLGDGRIVRISGDKMATVARTGKECAGQHEEHICGRPLGMKFHKNGLLYVIDAYHGLFTVDVKTGQKNNILPSSQLVDGHPLTFLNDLDIDEKENVIYLTQSSTKWSIGMVVVSILEHEASGRLLKYNLKTKEVSVLLTGLAFPNGVEFTHDGSALLIAQGNKNKIFKYHLQGTKKGLFIDLPFVLPGEPDNISKSKRGTYWVGIATARSKESPALHDNLANKPFLRKLILHVHRLSTTPITFLMGLIPHKKVNEIGFELKTGRIIADAPLNHGIIVEFDDKGKIVQSLHSPSGNISQISEVLEHNGYLYLGSWRNRFIGRVKL